MAHFGDYALLAEVAPGLYAGRRLRAPHPGPVFIELAPLSGSQQQAQLRARANAIGRASHLRLAPLIEAGSVAERSYAVYGFQPGTSLSRALSISQAHGHRPSIEWSVGTFAALLDGLECLHLALAELPKAQALHGHLGPASLVVSEQDELSLIELAVVRGACQGPGVPGYAAPEQVLEGEVDRRADLFAIGCLFFECVIGRPYVVGADDRARLAAAADPPPLPTLEQPELAAILASALDPDPDRRFSSAADFAEALRRLELGPARKTDGTHTRPFAFGYPGDEVEARTLAGQQTELRDFYVEGDPIPSWSSAELSSPTPEITRPIPSPQVRARITPRADGHPSAGPWPPTVWGLVVAALVIGVALGLRLAEREVVVPSRPAPPLVAAEAPAPLTPKVVPVPEPGLELAPAPEPEPVLETPRLRPRTPKPPPPATVVARKPPPSPAPTPSVRGLIDQARAAREELPPGEQRRQLDALLGKLAFKTQARVTLEEYRVLEEDLRKIVNPQEHP